MNSSIDHLLNEIEELPTTDRPAKIAEIYEELAILPKTELPMALQRLVMSGFYLNDDEARNLHALNCQGFALLAKGSGVDAANDKAIALAETIMISVMNRPRAHVIELLFHLAETANRLDLSRLNVFAFRELNKLVANPDAEIRTALLVQAVPMTRLLKPEEQFRQIERLYEFAAIDEPLRLKALEAIATVTDLLPETRECRDLVVRLNQEIYLLRLAQ